MFRLALALGKTVRQLLAEISVREFFEWVAFYEVEPWGAIRDDFRAGAVANAAVLPHLKTGAKTSPNEFIHEYDWARFLLSEEQRAEWDRVQAVEQQKQAAKTLHEKFLQTE